MVSFVNNKNQVSISPSIIVFTTFFLVGLYFLYYVRSIITLLFLAFIFMVALNPAVSWLETKIKLPRILAILTMYLLVIAILVSLVAVVVPPLSTELYQLLVSLNLPPVIQTELDNFTFSLENFSGLVSQVGSSVNVVISIITSTFSGVFTFFTLLVLSFYLMLDRKVLHRKVAWVSKNPTHMQEAKQLIDSLELQLGGWVRGQLVLMVLIGSITYIGLTLLGIPYALPLALLAGVLEIVPNLGPTVASIPAIILGYITGGPVMAGITTIFYVIVQQLENNVIVPKIMKDNVDVNPLVAIVTILIGLKLAGVIGALLAVPAYIVLRTLYSLWFNRLAAHSNA